MTGKKQALGKGLSALLENPGTDITSKTPAAEGKAAGSIAMIAIAQIETNPFQPRTYFEEQALHELAGSIKEHGIIQPITVRKLGYDKFQLISGERRFRASQLAGLTEVPAYIRIANDQTVLEMALVENIQREDLDAIEVAISYKRLIDECNLTQEALSQKVSKQRSTVTNYLRLLKLPAEIQLGIRDRKITMGHARAIVNIDKPETQLQIFNDILEQGLSVRQVEEKARWQNKFPEDKAKAEKAAQKAKNKSALSDSHLQLMEKLGESLKSAVEVSIKPNGEGKIMISFNSDSDFNRISELLLGSK